MKLRQAAEQTQERDARQRVIEAAKLQASITLAFDAMILGDASRFDDHSVPDLAELISEAKLQLREYRMANSDLSILLNDEYSKDRKTEVLNISTEAHNNILYLKDLVNKKQRAQDDFECQSKIILGDQTVSEIKLRCKNLASAWEDWVWKRDLSPLPDSQILEVNKGLAQLDTEFSKILDKVTEYSGWASDLGANSQLSDLNSLVNRTVKEKDDFTRAVRDEVKSRDLSEEKIKNALGLKINVPKFTGYISHPWTIIFTLHK